MEPSGDPFNEISLAPATGAPVNPMINAGAIACAGHGRRASTIDPLALLLDAYSRYAGRALALDEAVYLSERATGHRNRAIAHLLGSFDLLDVTPEEAVDLYFRQCAISVDCRDLALIACTLANGGINPVSRERAVSEGVVRGVLSVMTTCGMYDAAGDWLMSVGLPAKSGVSGGVFAVLPGRLGIGVYSPALDERGNSVRGIAVCRALSQDLALHLVRPGERTAPPIRARHALGAIRSKRVRRPEQRDAILAGSALTQIFELQGELGFMAAEAISRRMTEASVQPELVVVDLRRVARADRGGVDFLSTLGESLSGFGGALAVSGAVRRPRARAVGHAARLRRARRRARMVRGRAARPHRPRRGAGVGSARRARALLGARQPASSSGLLPGSARSKLRPGRSSSGRATVPARSSSSPREP